MLKHKVTAFRREEQGLLAIEALAGMLIFVIMMLSSYCMITLYMAHSMIGHALQETAESLAVESYRISKFHDNIFTTDDIHRGVFQLISGVRADNSQQSSIDYESDANYATEDFWFFTDDGRNTDPKKYVDTPNVVNSKLFDIAKERFATYFAGGAAEADKMLNTFRVTNGLEGLDFSASNLSGSDLTITVEYEINLLIRIDLLTAFKSKQSVCAKMWGKG